LSFHDVRFPTDISYGSAGGPGFKTDIIALQSGSEHRVSKWSSARRMFDVSYGVRSYAQLSNLQGFYMNREGSAHGFRFKDWLDYTSGNPGTIATTQADQELGTSAGASSETYQLRKRYVSGTQVFNRAITKPVAGSLKVGVEGTGGNIENIASTGTAHSDGNTITWSVNNLTGVVTVLALNNAQKVYAGFEFDVPVRFGDSSDEVMSASLDDFSSGTSRVELVELIGEDGTLADDFFYGGAKNLGTLTADTSLSVQDGRVIAFTPNTGSLNLRLPYHGTGPAIPTGGPYFYLVNLHASNAITVKDSTGATTIGTIAGNTQKTAVLGINASNAVTWYLMP